MSNSISFCKTCGSLNVVEMVAETCLHFPGLSGLNTEPIFVFPRFVLCTDCGFNQSTLSDKELEKVRLGAARISTRYKKVGRS